MDLSKVLDQLRRELAYLDEAIDSLERLQANVGRRRGRPPKALTEIRTGQSSLKTVGTRQVSGSDPTE